MQSYTPEIEAAMRHFGSLGFAVIRRHIWCAAKSDCQSDLHLAVHHADSQ